MSKTETSDWVVAVSYVDKPLHIMLNDDDVEVGQLCCIATATLAASTTSSFFLRDAAGALTRYISWRSGDRIRWKVLSALLNMAKFNVLYCIDMGSSRIVSSPLEPVFLELEFYKEGRSSLLPASFVLHPSHTSLYIH